MDLLYTLAGALYRFMDGRPFLPLVLILSVPVELVVIFVHELGHAVAGRRLLGGSAVITVGNVGKIAHIQVGWLEIDLHALSDPRRVAGHARRDMSRASAGDAVLIVLAGPMASFLGFVLAALALHAGPSTGLVHDVLWVATGASVAAAILNLLPLRLQEGRNGRVVRTDGRLALDALRLMSARG